MAWLWTAVMHVLFLNSIPPGFSSSNKESFVWSSGTCEENIKRKTAVCSGRRLSTVPDDLQRDLEILDLSRNNINSLVNTSFNRYSNLVELNLRDNNLSTIEIGALYPMKQLRILNLSVNRNIRIPSGKIFQWSSNLIYLYLFTNDLKTIPKDSLRWLPKLQLLNLQSNKIDFINITYCGTGPNLTVDLSANDFDSITAETFAFICNCDILNLDINPVREIDADIISALSVRSLSVSVHDKNRHRVLAQLFNGISRSRISELKIKDVWIRISSFPPWIFDSMHDKSLSLLYFDLGRLDFLQPLIFANLSRVAHLHMYSELQNLEPDFFQGMSKLSILTFHSSLKLINQYQSKWNLDLDRLILENNQLQSVDWYAFVGLENLTELDLNNNPNLAFLNITKSSGLSSLHTLDLRRTALISISIHAPLLKSFSLSVYYDISHDDDFVDLFSHTQLLEQIDMEFAAIVRLSYSKCNHSLFRGLQNLTTLGLSRNVKLTNLQEGTFLYQSSLAELDLRLCQLSTIESGAFEGLHSLHTLRLESNKLHNFPGNVFHGMKQLTILNLDHNLLTAFDKHIFSDTMISVLTISDNQLVRLSSTTFRPVVHVLKSIDISWNPLECNCEMKWLLEWFRGSLEIMNQNFTLCSSSASIKPLREKPIMSLNLSDHCTPNIPLYLSLVFASVLIFATITVIYINRWVLKYNLFLMKLKIFGYAVMQDPREHTDYRYDLNVMFCDDDREWARGYLRPGLEEKLPHFVRTAYGDEDLTPGMYYMDAVLDLVENSFKTILLLSRAAILNDWFMVKFRLTLDYVNDIQTDNVLVIFIEEIPREEEPYRLQLYIDDGGPHLTWMEDEQNQENFWTELLGSITVNLTRTHLIPHE